MKKLILPLIVLLGIFSSVEAQTVLFSTGFEVGEPTMLYDYDPTGTFSGVIAGTQSLYPFTGFNHAYIDPASTNSPGYYINAVTSTQNQYTFDSGYYYVFQVNVSVPTGVCQGGLGISLGTNTDYTTMSGSSDIVKSFSSNDVGGSGTYNYYEYTYACTQTMTRHIGYLMQAQGCTGRDLAIDDLVVLKYSCLENYYSSYPGVTTPSSSCSDVSDLTEMLGNPVFDNYIHTTAPIVFSNGCVGPNPRTVISVTPTTSTLDITVDSLGVGFGGNVEIQLYTGACGGSTFYSSNCGSAPLTLSTSGLSPGVEHLIVISSSAGSTGSSASFGLCISDQGFPCSVAPYPPCESTFSCSLSGSVSQGTTLDCNGDSDATATITPTGAEGSVTYSWDAGAATTSATNTGLSAGWYHVTITDDSSCTYTDSINITQPTALSASGGITQQITCNNLNDGSIIASGSGGTGSYTYSLDNSSYQGTNGFSNLAGGTYKIYVKDDNGCVDSTSSTYTIVNPSAVNIIGQIDNHITCNNNNDGQVSVATVSGGVGSYQYSIDDISYVAADSFSNLSGAGYTIYVQDGNGCKTNTGLLTIINPAALNIVAQKNGALCNGASDGEMYASSHSGGTGVHYFSVDNSNYSTDTVINVSAGNYRMYIKDDNGCVDSSSLRTVNEPNALVITAQKDADVTCANPSAGQVSVNTSSGGTGIRYYSLDTISANFSTSTTFTGLGVGDYKIYIKDDNSCLDSSTAVSVANPGAPTLNNVTIDSISCNNVSDATLTASASGGTGFLNYSLSSNSGYSIINAFSSISAGNHTIYVKDDNNCKDSMTVNVANPTALSISGKIDNHLTCNNSNDGQISLVSANGGTGTLQYSIDADPFGAATTWSSLGGGNHTIYVKDQNDCLANSSTLTLNNPTALSVSAQKDNDITCNNDNDGQISLVSSTGGTGSLSFSLDNITFGSTSPFSNLSGGTYKIYVKDDNNCRDSTSGITINNPNTLSISGQKDNDVSCYNAGDGQVSVSTSSGGVGTRQFSIDNSIFGTGTTFSGLNGGDYKIYITDDNNCKDSTSTFTISEPNEIIITADLDNNLKCNNDNDGQITGHAIGGLGGPFTFSKDNSTYGSDSVFSNLAGNSYRIYVQEGSCVDSSSVINLINPAPFNIIVDVTNANCTNPNGRLDAVSSGGTGAHYFSLDNVTYSSSSVFDNLQPNSYTVYAKDANGCSANSIGNTIQSPTPIEITPSVTKSDCDLDNGGISLSVANGAAPYSYQWNSGDTTIAISNKAAGSYKVTVTDALGCSSERSIDIGNINAPTISETITNVSCNGADDGAISVNVSGGVTPYSYFWSTGSTSQNLSNLNGSFYTLTVRDADGCSAIGSYTVVEPEVLTVSFNSSNTNCGATTGSIEANPAGGTAPYTFSWLAGGTDSIKSSVGVGLYEVTITDANNCQVTNTGSVSENDGPSVTLNSKTQSSCGNQNGSVDINIVEGTTSIDSIIWSNGTYSEDLLNATAGIYNVTVKDVGNCKGILSVEIEDSKPKNQEICLVTVDTATNKNLVVWQKPADRGRVLSYNIYRETNQANVFQFVSNVHVDSLSEYSDSVADPTVRSWRYKVASVDSCGEESVLSQYHKTIHLVKSSFGGSNFLIWDDYEGFSFLSYKVWRYSVQTGWQIIATLPNNLHSYTDVNPTGTSLNYFIEAEPLSPCTSDKANTYGSTRSNSDASKASTVVAVDFKSFLQVVNVGDTVIFTDLSTGPVESREWVFEGGNPSTSSDSIVKVVYGAQGTYDAQLLVYNSTSRDSLVKLDYIIVNPNGIEENSILNVKIHPNPSEGIFNVDIQTKDQKVVSMEVYNTLNQKIRTQKVLNNTTIDLSDEPSGVYIVQLISETGSYNFRIIKE